MPTTLISVIGKPANGRYRPAKYELNGKIYETDFFFLPLLKHFQPEKFYLVGTNDSIWNVVDEVKQKEKFDYEKVIVPFGIHAEEIWQIFEQIIQLPLEGQKLIIDITHGFRAIPVAVFMAVLYFQTVKQDVWVKDVLYGNYEARDSTTGIAPVVHLTSLLDMNEWIRAARRFVQYGDGDLLIRKIETRLSASEKNERYLQAFRNFIDNLQLNFVSQIPYAVRWLQTTMDKEVGRELSRIPTYRLLQPLIQHRLDLFIQEEPEWKKQWRIADWFFHNRQYTQSLIVLREALITFTCNLMGFKSTRIENREKKVAYLHTVMVYQDNEAELNKKGLSSVQIQKIQTLLKQVQELIGENHYNKWANIISQVSEARNNVGHALIRGKGKNERVDPHEQIQYLQQWLTEALQIFETILSVDESVQRQVVEYLNQVIQLITGKTPRLYLIINSGIHPIEEQLKQQFGKDILYEVVTRGNVELNTEAQIVQRVKEIVARHPGMEIAIVPSGYPYLITLVYNTVVQITSKHPVYLQFDKETHQYREKILDPRQYLSGGRR